MTHALWALRVVCCTVDGPISEGLARALEHREWRDIVGGAESLVS